MICKFTVLIMLHCQQQLPGSCTQFFTLSFFFTFFLVIYFSSSFFLFLHLYLQSKCIQFESVCFFCLFVVVDVELIYYYVHKQNARSEIFIIGAKKSCWKRDFINDVRDIVGKNFNYGLKTIVSNIIL